MQEEGRHAVLRRELLALTNDSPSNCDRALRRKCADGSLVRASQGIYGIGRAKVFDIVPEVMPKLGYDIVPVQRVKGYSQKSGGAIWRLNKPCRRMIRKRGVWATFAGPSGTVMNAIDMDTSMGVQSTNRQIEDHFHRFEWCHSKARAEKDLVVQQALNALEDFEDERTDLAISGSTALAHYHRLISRFSENLNIRILLKPPVAALPAELRIAHLNDIARRIEEHILFSLPYVKPTKKGRTRRDAVIQTTVFHDTPVAPHDEVLSGLKVELVYVPLLLDLATDLDRNAKRLPTAGATRADLVRHVHDLSTMSFLLNRLKDQFRRIAFRGEVTHANIDQTMTELSKPIWATHYESYMHRMGARTISNLPGYDPQWNLVFERFAQTAEILLNEKKLPI